MNLLFFSLIHKTQRYLNCAITTHRKVGWKHNFMTKRRLCTFSIAVVNQMMITL